MNNTFYHLRLVVTIASLLVGLVAKAQHTNQDYVVTIAGDTLRGRIRLAGRASQTLKLYRPAEAAATFTADQANSYGTATTPLKVSKQIGPRGSRRFLVPLAQGYVNLYVGKNGAGEVRYYLQPADTAYAVEIAPNLAQLAYARLFSSCLDLQIGTSNFQQRYPYTANGLIKLVTDYSKCRQQSTTPLKTPSGTRASFGIKAGVNNSAFNLATDSYAQRVYDTNHSAPISYEAGLVMLLTTRSNFALQLEGNYLSLSSNYGPAPPANYNSGIYIGTYSVRVRYSQLQLPILLRYNFSHGLITPYLNLGPVAGVNFNNKSIKSAYDITGTATTDEPYSAAIGTIAVGGAGSVGVALRTTRSLALFAESRYDYITDNLSNGVHHSSLHFNLGILF